MYRYVKIGRDSDAARLSAPQNEKCTLGMFTSLWSTYNSATSRCRTHSDVRIVRRAWTRADGPSAYSRASGARYGRICTGPAEGEAAARGT